MTVTNPLSELFHEARGTLSPVNRETAEALQREAPPRALAVANAVAALHAPWWGFAAYGVVYAMTVMAIGALLFAGLLQGAAHHFHVLDGYDWPAYFWPALVVTAPLTFLPFRAWVRRRRRELVEVARNGTAVAGRITKATVVTVSGKAHSTQLTITTGDTGSNGFHGFVPRGPDWAAPGRAVEVITLPALAYAILVCPDGGTRPLKRRPA